jgi:hypothetical protein
MSKYHFLYGSKVSTVEHENDKDAAEAAAKDENVLRVQNDDTRKHVYEKTAKAVAKFAALLLAFVMLMGMAASAATVIGVNGIVGNPSYAVISTSGTTNSTSQPTNGLYTAGIAGNTIETNVLFLNAGGTQDGDVIVQFIASATAASTTNVVFVLSSSVQPLYITNNPTTGANGSASPRQTYATVTMALNGTALVTTNVVFSKFSTPPLANGLNLYLESIQNGAGTASLTNYSVLSVQ